MGSVTPMGIMPDEIRGLLPVTGSGAKRLINKIMDVDNANITENIREIFKIAYFLYVSNGTIAAAVNKLVEYALTELDYETENQEALEIVKDILENKLKIIDIIFKLGLDYFIYGNAFASVVAPFMREFVGVYTKTVYTPKVVNGQPNWEFKEKQLYFRGPNSYEPVEVRDTILKNRNFNIVVWNPSEIEINYNEYANVAEYYVKINKGFVKRLMKDEFLLRTTPYAFLEAIIKGTTTVKLNQNNLVVFQRVSPSGKFTPWGLPWIVHAFKDTYYYMLLESAQEAILSERMVPYRYIYPPTELITQGSPLTLDLNDWKRKVTTALTNWKLNPNNIQIFPVPVGVGQLSGEGKSVTVFAEMDFANNQIIQDLQVPMEFIKGGLTWSGSSVSLRMLENHFINFRERIEEILNKIVAIILNILELPKVSVKLRPFKMADDIQRKQMYLQLYQMQTISKKTLLKEFDIDYERELELQRQEMLRELELQKQQFIEQQKMQVEAQAVVATMQQPEVDIPENQPLGDQARLMGLSQYLPTQAMQPPMPYPPMTPEMMRQMPVEQQADMRPLPEQKPPRRQNSPI